MDLSDKNLAKWTLIKTKGAKPDPRWHHTATFDGRHTIVLFGGYTSDFARGVPGTKRALRRYHQDVWLFSTKTETWSQPAPGLLDAEGDLLRPWVDLPCARGAHAACLVEQKVAAEPEEGAAADAAPAMLLKRQLFVFGGAFWLVAW